MYPAGQPPGSPLAIGPDSVITLCLYAPYGVGDVALTRRDERSPGGWGADMDAVAKLVAALEAVITRMWERVEGTAKRIRFISITADLEKHLWTSRAADG